MNQDRAKHSKYLLRCLNSLPHHYQGEDANRLPLLFFILGSLYILEEVSVFAADNKIRISRWILSLQTDGGGFNGTLDLENLSPSGNLLHSFFALQILALLEDDLSLLNRRSLLAFITSCQNPDGSFAPTPNSLEIDLRSSLAAIGLSFLLDDWSHIDVDRAVAFILNCQSFGQNPSLEGHAGSTFCAVASLTLCNQLYRLNDKTLTISWLSHRLVKGEKEYDPEDAEETVLDALGYQGRVNKYRDCCYTFWVGATLQILSPSMATLSNCQATQYLDACQDLTTGGFAKNPESYPGTLSNSSTIRLLTSQTDVYHTHFALASWTLIDHRQSSVFLNPCLDIPQKVVDFVQNRWR